MSPSAIPIATLPADGGEVRITIGAITRGKAEGARFVDVRHFDRITPARIMVPTRRGVALPVSQLAELIAALTQAQTRARELGLVGGAS